jgi:hypothetical protein
MMHLDDVSLARDIFEDLVEPISMIHQSNRTVVVNLDWPIEKAVPHPLDVFVVAAVPVASLEGFDCLDGFEAGDSRFEIG